MCTARRSFRTSRDKSISKIPEGITLPLWWRKFHLISHLHLQLPCCNSKVIPQHDLVGILPSFAPALLNPELHQDKPYTWHGYNQHLLGLKPEWLQICLFRPMNISFKGHSGGCSHPDSFRLGLFLILHAFKVFLWQQVCSRCCPQGRIFRRLGTVQYLSTKRELCINIFLAFWKRKNWSVVLCNCSEKSQCCSSKDLTI